MANLTTNFSFLKPLVNNATDQDLWGGYLNTNFDSLDTLIKANRDWPKRTITGTETITTADRHMMLLCDATTAAFSENLISAASAGDGFELTITKIDVSGHAVTITPNGADKIAGNATWPLTGQGDAATIVSDGVATWNFKGNKTTPSAVSSASTTVSGILKLATNALALAGVDATTALTPAALASLATISGSNFSIVLGDITIQGGTVASSVNPTVVFPTHFSDTPLAVLLTGMFPVSSTYSVVLNGAPTNTGFVTHTFSTGSGSAVALAVSWIAVGKT